MNIQKSRVDTAEHKVRDSKNTLIQKVPIIQMDILQVQNHKPKNRKKGFQCRDNDKKEKRKCQDYTNQDQREKIQRKFF